MEKKSLEVLKLYVNVCSLVSFDFLLFENGGMLLSRYVFLRVVAYTSSNSLSYKRFLFYFFEKKWAAFLVVYYTLYSCSIVIISMHILSHVLNLHALILNV